MLLYIYNNYMHLTNGVMDDFKAEAIGLNGPIYRAYKATEDITEYVCVHMKTLACAPVEGPFVGISKMSLPSTLPAIGISVQDVDRYDELKVGVFGPVTNASWNFLLPEENGNDYELRYVYVGDNGAPVQYRTGEEPTYGLQVIGLVEDRHTLFVKPEVIWGGIHA